MKTGGLAFTAYDRAGWALMRELADDRDELPPWEEVEPHITAMRDEPAVDLITFDAVTVLAASRWCRNHGYRLDHHGRVAFLKRTAALFHTAAPAGSA
jgi:hypothetical protein